MQLILIFQIILIFFAHNFYFLMNSIDDFKIRVGERLKEFIKHQRQNQTEFAEKIGVKNTALSAVTRGKIGISSDLAYTIINFYPELNWDWLFVGRGLMTGDEISEVGRPKDAENKETNFSYAILEEKIRGLERELRLKDEQLILKDEIINLLKNK
jgi:transcriptional regulator with XRE-family HTH domain